jgi:hypothetical protein
MHREDSVLTRPSISTTGPGSPSFRRFVWASGLAWLALAIGTGTFYGAEPTKLDFNLDVRPILSDRCFSCHGPDSASRKGKLRLDTADGAHKLLDDGWAVVKPGDPAKSEVVRRIFTDDEDDLMPPPKSNLKLLPAEKQLLKRWIAEGGEYRPHWSFIPVELVAVPGDGKSNPIDAFVRARLAKLGLHPSSPADRTTLLRRVALGVTGLPPTSAEVEAFLKDSGPDAYPRAVERYLSSPAYGERMAMDWLDLARFSDTYGYQADVYRDMSPWRDWVISAFNRNLPYDRFLIWQLAGDLLPNATDEQRLATAFNRLHRQTNEGGSIDEEFRTEYCMDRVNTVGTAMLGLTIECARCHDHKYDPITQRDYYSLYAFFNSIDESGMYAHFTRATPSPSLPLWKKDQSAERAELALRRIRAERALASAEIDAKPAFKRWIKQGVAVVPPSPVAWFTFDTIANGKSADAFGTNGARLIDGPEPVVGHSGGGLRFSGDNSVACKGVGDFHRTDPFSIDLWMNPAEIQVQAVIVHHSQAAEDAAHRGYEVVLKHGKPFFGLSHFWPGNAIAIQAQDALPTNHWTRLTVTYDGSSSASGLKIYRDGRVMATDMVRDHLTQDILHRAEWGDALAGQIDLTVGARFRDSGFKDGEVDDFRVYDQCLTAAEVAAPADGAGKDLRDLDLFGHFLARDYQPYRDAMAEMHAVRVAENTLQSGTREIMVMEEMAKPRPAFVLNRGAYDAPGEAVERNTPASILPFPANLPRNRLGLAKWMVDRGNPLPSRVVVNRIWKQHFGTGLVATPENFGTQGAVPSEPELLDWLAGWFMDQDWDVKALHRLILSSHTFKQSSVASPELMERDPDNRFLARGPKHRLQAEEIRDAALTASGLLNPKVGGPSVKPYQPAGLWEASGTGASYSQDHGDALYRRSLYTYWKRTAPPPAMLTFDAVSREVCTAKREVTTTPLQALVLLNDPQFVEASRVLAEHLLRAYPKKGDERARGAFLALIGRYPDAAELGVLGQLFAEQRSLFSKDTAGAEKLLAIGESKRSTDLDPADFAATTMLVSAVMNFDEFVMKR